MTKFIFNATILYAGEAKNIAFTLSQWRGWPSINPLRTAPQPVYGGNHELLAERCCREINALLHAGFPLEALVAAGRLSRSTHAEILRSAAEAQEAVCHSVRSFA
jgi:hypothetical protein